MKKIAKRFMAFFLATVIILTIGLFSTNSFITKADATTTNKTRAEAIKWLESKEGIEVDYDGVYGGQCVDLIYAYCAYLGFAHSGPNASTYTTYKIPSDWARVQGGKKPQKGDIIIYAGAGGYGHIAIYENDSSIWHQNTGGKKYVVNESCNYKDKKASDGSTYWGYIRPDFTDARSSIVKISFNGNGGTSSSSSGTYVVGEIYGNSMPSATRDGYAFDGWYTVADGGTRVNRSSTVTSGNKTLYAHWTKNQTDALEVGHVYKIYNEKSGLVLAADDNKKGKSVCQRNNGEKGMNELWRVTGIDSDGCYSFELLNGCKTALDIDADNQYAYGQRLQVWEKNGHNAQKFSIIKRGDKSGYSGLYSIHSKHSGRAIDVSDSSTKSGAVLHQWDYHGSNNQLFYFEEVESRNVTFYDNFNNNYIASPAEEYAHINSATPTGHYSSRAADYVKVTLKPETDSLYIQSLKAGSSGNDMKWLALINGSYTNNFAVKNDSTMVLSFRAKSSVSGAKMYFRWGYDKEYQSVTLTTSWSNYTVELKRTVDSGNNIHPYIDKACNVEMTDIALYEKGTTGYIGDTDAYTVQTVVANVNNDYITPAPLPRNNRSGYTFLGWFTKRVGGTRVAGAAEYFSAPLDGDQCLYAHWSKDATATYTLTYNANGGSGAPLSQSGATSYTVSSTKPTKSGYTFLGWSTSSSATSATYVSGNIITLSSNTTLYAVWKKNAATTYSLTYNANGGSGAPSSQSGATSYTVSSTKPTRSGYTFLGWSTSSTATSATYVGGNTISISANTTLYAVWKKNAATTYTLTYNANGGSGAPDAETFNPGESVTISEFMPFCWGYTFMGWSETADFSSTVYYPGDEVYFDGNTDLIAIWTEHYVYQGYSGLEFSKEQPYFCIKFVPEKTDEYVIKTTTVYDTVDTVGYLVNSNGETIVGDDNSGEDSNFKISYNFTKGQTYCIYITTYNNDYGNVGLTVMPTAEVTYDANGGYGAPDMSSHDIEYNIPYDEPHRKDFIFIGWSEDKNAYYPSYYPGEYIYVTEDITLYAVWSNGASEFYVYYDANGGTNAPQSQFIERNAIGYIPDEQPIRDGYVFVGWCQSADGNGQMYYPGSMIRQSDNQGDTVFYAIWEADNYFITVSNGKASKNSAPEGEIITLTAYDAPEGKVFDKWIISGATVTNVTSSTTTFIMPSNNVTATATYRDKAVTPVTTYAITVTNGTASVSKAITGTVVTLTAPQVNGKIFSHWEVSGATVADKNANETTFTMENSEVTAEAIYNDCDCKCHQGGIAGFFFKIVLFFQKLFGKNLECICGAKH